MQGKLPEEIKPKHPEKELNGMDLAHMRTTDAKNRRTYTMETECSYIVRPTIRPRLAYTKANRLFQFKDN